MQDVGPIRARVVVKCAQNGSPQRQYIGNSEENPHHNMNAVITRKALLQGKDQKENGFHEIENKKLPFK